LVLGIGMNVASACQILIYACWNAFLHLLHACNNKLLPGQHSPAAKQTGTDRQTDRRTDGRTDGRTDCQPLQFWRRVQLSYKNITINYIEWRKSISSKWPASVAFVRHF